MAEFFPQLGEDDEKREITIENLLTHTLGIEWYEWDGGNGISMTAELPPTFRRIAKYDK